MYEDTDEGEEVDEGVCEDAVEEDEQDEEEDKEKDKDCVDNAVQTKEQLLPERRSRRLKSEVKILGFLYLHALCVDTFALAIVVFLEGKQGSKRHHTF